MKKKQTASKKKTRRGSAVALTVTPDGIRQLARQLGTSQAAVKRMLSRQKNPAAAGRVEVRGKRIVFVR